MIGAEARADDFEVHAGFIDVGNDAEMIDVNRGARLFQTKNCVSCHEQRRKQTGAPDLTASTERYSPITMSAAIWRHGPAMNEALDREKLPWPVLNATEMADLISYLNSRLIRRVAQSR